jgi:NTE family protein
MRPFLSYEKMTYVVPTDNAGNQELESTSYGGGIGFGINLTNRFRTDLNFAAYDDESVVNFLDGYDQNFNAKEINLRFLYDSLDNYNFPNRGFLGHIRLTKDAKTWGSDYDYEQIYATFQKPLSYLDNSFILTAQFGKTNIKTPLDDAITVYDKFYLGGMFNLSGYQKYELVGNNVVFGNLMYRYRIKNGGFFGSLGMPLYTGMTIESGGVWDDGNSFSSSDLKYSASLYVAADTPFGAFYFTYGYADKDHTSLYLTLGEKF